MLNFNVKQLSVKQAQYFKQTWILLYLQNKLYCFGMEGLSVVLETIKTKWKRKSQNITWLRMTQSVKEVFLFFGWTWMKVLSPENSKYHKEGLCF